MLLLVLVVVAAAGTAALSLSAAASQRAGRRQAVCRLCCLSCCSCTPSSSLSLTRLHVHLRDRAAAVSDAALRRFEAYHAQRPDAELALIAYQTLLDIITESNGLGAPRLTPFVSLALLLLLLFFLLLL